MKLLCMDTTPNSKGKPKNESSVFETLRPARNSSTRVCRITKQSEIQFNACIRKAFNIVVVYHMNFLRFYYLNVTYNACNKHFR